MKAIEIEVIDKTLTLKKLKMAMETLEKILTSSQDSTYNAAEIHELLSEVIEHVTLGALPKVAGFRRHDGDLH